MATVTFLAFVLGATAAAAVVLLWMRHQEATRRHQTPPAVRTVECATCGRVLPVSEAVVVADTFDDDDEGQMLGGTVCVVEFCLEHAPAP